MAMLVADGPVPVLPTPVAHRGHRAGKAAFGRDLPDHVLAVPRPRMPASTRTVRHIVMRGTQKFRYFRVVQNEGIREGAAGSVAQVV